jgi:hypothetical protein
MRNENDVDRPAPVDERTAAPAENFDPYVEPEGEGHRPDDPLKQPEQINDPTGANGPSYEQNQGTPGEHHGGSTDPNNTLTHADSGDESVR